jgi:hypothetical protein
MKGLALALGVAAAAALAPFTASAAIYNFATVLSGLNETPPVLSTGTGFASLEWDTTLHSADLSITWEDLVGTTTASHVHAPPAGAVPGTFQVATTLPSFPGFPTGVRAGTFNLTFATNAASSYSAGFLAANGGTGAGAEAAFLGFLLDGQNYLNIHTSAASGGFPAGEIRGTFVRVPEPGTWALMLLGFGTAGAMLRRRRAAAFA